MFREFRDFLLRGNLLELAVAVVIGTAFATLVSAFTQGLITPLIAAVGGAPDFSALSFTINDSRFRYGAFLNALVSFLIVAGGVFFFVVKPLNTLMAPGRPGRRRARRPGNAGVHQRDPGASPPLRVLHRRGRSA